MIFRFAARRGAHQLVVFELGADVKVRLVVSDGASHAEIGPRRTAQRLAQVGHGRRPFARNSVELDLARFDQVGANRDTVGARHRGDEQERQERRLGRRHTETPNRLHDLDRGDDCEREPHDEKPALFVHWIGAEHGTKRGDEDCDQMDDGREDARADEGNADERALREDRAPGRAAAERVEQRRQREQRERHRAYVTYVAVGRRPGDTRRGRWPRAPSRAPTNAIPRYRGRRGARACAFARLLFHVPGSGGIDAERERGQAVGDQVDPEDHERRERRPASDERRDEHGDERGPRSTRAGRR